MFIFQRLETCQCRRSSFQRMKTYHREQFRKDDTYQVKRVDDSPLSTNHPRDKKIIINGFLEHIIKLHLFRTSVQPLNKQFYALYFYSVPSTNILKIKYWNRFEARQVTDIVTNFTIILKW